MIAAEHTGRLTGVVISATGDGGLSVSVDGMPAMLAVVDDSGRIVAAGPAVAREAEAVACNAFRAMWQGCWGVDRGEKTDADGED